MKLTRNVFAKVTVALVIVAGVESALAQTNSRSNSRQRSEPESRRSQRVRMPDVEVVSPDGSLKFTVLSNAEQLTFTIAMDQTTVLDPSPIILKLDGWDLSSGVAFSNVERYAIQETYDWYGAHSRATNRCNGVRIALQHDLSQIDYTLEIRAFNDGVAFRQIIPGETNTSRVPDEYSTFVLPAGSTVWFGGMEGHYETGYSQKDISEIQPGEWAGPPLTARLPGNRGYLSLTEADLVGYAGMGLEADGRRGWTIGLGHRQPLNWPFELRYGRETARRLGQPAAITGTITTPWRVLMIGRDLNALVNSTIVPNLCPPPDPKLFPKGIKTDWIKPGRAAWAYVDGRPDGFEGFKEFSREAGELGFEHHVIEGVWNNWTMDQRKEIASYSKQRVVDLYFWKHSRSLRTPEAREEFFKMLQDCGVAGAKIDFFDHEGKDTVDLYETLLREAAKYHISLIFHGADKPTGLARTWPNEMVREAVRGMESSRMSDRARHQATLPFMRLLAGPADYTTMVFNQRRGDTTWANQIASMAIFSAPLLTIAANPQSILTNAAVEVIKSIPAVWDETVVLPDSEIGECVAFARRAGKTWFLAIMNGSEARTIRVPLSFLGSGSYAATLVSDADGKSDAIKLDHSELEAGKILTIDLQAGGGFIGKFSRN